MPINMNTEIIMGVALIAFGVFSFAKGTSQHLAKDHYIKSAQEVSTLVNCATEAHNISNTIVKNNTTTKNYE